MNTPESPPPLTRAAAPSWVAPAFAAFAVVLIPWIAYLAVSLPEAARAYERLPWVGFDIAEMAGLAATAMLAWRGSVRVAFAATVTATLLVIDAWFDVTTSIRTADVMSALAMSVVELGLAGVCVWIAYHAERMLRTHIRHLLRRSRRAAATAPPANVAGS